MEGFVVFSPYKSLKGFDKGGRGSSNCYNAYTCLQYRIVQEGLREFWFWCK